MARAKKGRVGTAANNTPKKIYSAGIYARLSVDSDERKNESIETQIEIASQFIRQQADMELYGSYTDLGRTGTNFEREGFEQMMRDVRMRKIDCIVVKDLSRFGRNHIEAGNYIEKIFPFLGVRFVAVTDKFDSLSVSGKDEAFGVNLKNLVNEMYARDIGAKVRSSKKAKWEQGSYTGGVPPYGYRAEWVGDKKRLFPDYPAADIVKKIFDLFISGSNMKEIALWLYRHKVVRPAEYHKTGRPYCQEGGSLEQWPRGTVKMVLTNPVYMGCLVQGKSCGGNGRHGMEAFGWSVNGHTHEAIVSEGLFFKAAARFEELAVYCNQKGYSKRVPLEPDIFADILYCGDCGCKMKRITAIKELRSKGRVRAYSYHCPNASRIDTNKCTAKSITLHALGNIVKEAARMETIVCEVQPKGIAELQSQELEKAKEKWEEGLLELDKELETIAKAGSEQYMKYRMGGIDADTFQRIKGEHNRKIISNQAKRADIEGKLRAVGEGKAPQKDLLQILEGQNGADGLPPELIQALVQRIEVYPSHRVKVVFAFHKDSASFAGGEALPNG